MTTPQHGTRTANRSIRALAGTEPSSSRGWVGESVTRTRTACADKAWRAVRASVISSGWGAELKVTSTHGGPGTARYVGTWWDGSHHNGPT